MMYTMMIMIADDVSMITVFYRNIIKMLMLTWFIPFTRYNFR